MPLFIFTSETMLSFFTGNYENGVLITGFPKIITKTLKTTVWIDILSTTLFVICEQGYVNNLYEIVIFLRLKRLFQYYE